MNTKSSSSSFSKIKNEIKNEKKDEKNSIDALLADLEQYMFTQETLLGYQEPCKGNVESVEKVKKEMIPLEKKPAKNDFFSPKQKDGLFWCFYVIKNGETEYELLNQQKINLIIEKKIKIELVDKLREEKTIFKKQAIKFPSLTHMENALVNDQTIDLGTFIALCHLAKKNIMYVFKKMYFEWIPYPGEEVHIVKKVEEFSKPIRYLYEGTQSERVEKYRANHFQVESWDKTIKAISAYKIAELMEICQKLGIETTYHDEKMAKIRNKSKQMLYEAIVQG